VPKIDHVLESTTVKQRTSNAKTSSKYGKMTVNFALNNSVIKTTQTVP